MSESTNGRARTQPLARNAYREGQILHARDLERESDYFLARSRQHNALGHGPGILLGLQIIAFKRGTEEAVAEEELAASGPIPLDLAITAGAAIDTLGRLIVVPKRESVRIDLATLPAVLPADTYRLELLYGRGGATRTQRNGSATCADEGAGGSEVRESFGLRLVKYDPEEEPSELDLGSVLDGPVDDPTALAPLTLARIEWDGTNYVGYSNSDRVYAPVSGHRLVSPSGRAELELRDDLGRFAVRTAPLPDPTADDPFTPSSPQDRLTLDEDGRLWVRSDVSVGTDGVGFRMSDDTVNPSPWRARFVQTSPGAPFRKKVDATTELPASEYAPGDRELRVVFQRESGQFSGTGRHRVVVGMLNSDGTFDPAVVVYDQPPEDTGRGFGVVEICGDLYVRGTAFIHSVRKAPDSGDPNEQLDFILRQLAGPLAGAFRAFLTSDPQWLEEFAAVMAAKIGQAGAIQNAVIAALTASTTFTNNVINAAVTQAVAQAVPAAVTQAVAQAVPAAVAAVQQTGNLTNILNAAAALLDDTTGGSSQPLPADLSAKILAAMYRRLAYDPNLKNQIINSLPALSSERGWVTQALDWLP